MASVFSSGICASVCHRLKLINIVAYACGCSIHFYLGINVFYVLFKSSFLTYGPTMVVRKSCLIFGTFSDRVRLIYSRVLHGLQYTLIMNVAQ